MFELLELVELLPDILEIVGVTKEYHDREVDAQVRLQTFALATLAEHPRTSTPRPRTLT